ncbi:hypothetical protein NE237_032896 [Protea cynaroides]|uniref:Uncharacterized protein n=1 Tax=Protea cynaroides TaxID=273540 RepID=A0A9Q0L580_9MAGN|nr:hypothetical protein NE237_032896 [Protea cynaroides]
MGSILSAGGKGLEQGGLLGVVGIADVDDAELRLAFQGLQDCTIAGDVTECGLRANLLELQPHLLGGVEGVGHIGGGSEIVVAVLPGVGDVIEKGLEEVGGKLLFCIAVGGAQIASAVIV